MHAFVVDAFTDELFGGNPAGVVLCDTGRGPADAVWMQRVAAEFRHAETAFVQSREDGGFDLRWFTPLVEVDLCGHATLASAHVLFSHGRGLPITFHTRSGPLIARRGPEHIELDFPSQPVHRTDVPLGLEPALGIEIDRAWTNDIDLLIEARSASEVAELRPDLAALHRLRHRGLIVTAAAPASADHDFVSRFFAPRVGVDEDPVTGSAHTALGPFWADRLGRTSLTGVQLSARRGRVGVDVLGDRVTLRGSAVTFLAGELAG